MEITKVPLSNNDMLRYILNLIRYDIPILMSGKSSIGKSYTMLELAKQWGMPNSVLYVGSEKADNIEGLPKLIDEKAIENENVLTYYKPYWFPQSNLIQAAVKRGYDVFNEKIKPNFANAKSLNLPYETVMGLMYAIGNLTFSGNNEVQDFDFIDKTGFITNEENVICKNKITLTRTLVPKGEDLVKYPNELYDLSLFISTLSGLGNYWLILDELDKVQEEEADKFAPMLHIVRERRLKNYSLRELNDGKGADVSMNVVNNSYTPIYNMIEDSLKTGKSVLDTRIISISNKTDNIVDISDALFKRFVQVIIHDILELRPPSAKLSTIRTCLSSIETKIGGGQGDLTVGKLQEINLQWQYGFLPRILNNNDTEGNFIRNNYLNTVASALMIADDITREQKVKKLGEGTALYKLCVDNFDEDIKVEDAEGINVPVPNLVMDCLSSQISPSTVADVEVVRNPLDIIKEFQSKELNDLDTSLEVYDFLMAKYNLIPKSENKSYEIEDLIRYAFDFIRYTAYSDGFTEDKIKNEVSYNPLSINEYLIPVIIKFTLKVVTKDETISFDDKDRLLSAHAEMWSNFAIPEHIAELKGNPDLTNKLFYGGEDSLWGSSDLNADDFQNSFVNKFNTDNIELFEEFIKEYMTMADTQREEFKDFIEYAKKYRADDILAIKNKKVESLKRQTPPNPKEVMNAIQQFKNLFGV
jgi:hypothetical protein